MNWQNRVPNASHTLLLLGTVLFIALALPTVNVNGAAQAVTFSRTPSGYNNQTGAFTLGTALTNDAGDGGVCVSYDYFIFSAQAEQTLQGQVKVAAGKQVYYVVLNSPYQLNSFENSNCGVGNWGQVQNAGSATASTISWTARKNGQYALVFMANGFYGNTLYFNQ